ncbi:hypothetical protein MM213_10160 [Belliella sp. R4-6]|uniref:Uncharacterized protein n=2 Tax=Belliella TaxID=232244 RepID=A0ABS9URE9_9BACT|nr:MULTISPECIES: hypothetical protein [Belliella]MCH7399200.1 hypothetical protein [Belliella calami]MCH7413849.1 hypothetical protein [Belliella alkalica]
METLFSLVLLTAIYGLAFLSIMPERYIKKLSPSYHHKHLPEYKKFALGGSIFLCFLVGYICASAMLYFFI